jgi:hypothetical protein
LGIDNDTVWSIIRDNIPELLSQLEAIQRQIDNHQTDQGWGFANGEHNLNLQPARFRYNVG